MEHLLRPGIAAGVAAAVAGAGLIALTPPAPPAPLHADVQLSSDVFSALADNAQNVFTDLGDALTLVTQLHLGNGADFLFGAGANVLFMPENLVTAGIAALTGVSNPNFFASALPFLLNPDVLGQLGQDLQAFILLGGDVLQYLGSDNLTGAFGVVAEGFNLALLGIPDELVAGTLLALGL